MAFQREVINNIIPDVKPDLIHCNDWDDRADPGRRPADRDPVPLHGAQHPHPQGDAGPDRRPRHRRGAVLGRILYYERPPLNYEESRSNNPVDMLASGIFAAHFINTVSPTFLKEVVEGRHPFVPDNIRREMAGKYYSGCASGILNSPDETSTPETDPYIEVKYDAETHVKGKQVNKIAFQTRTGLREDQNAPLFFWPSRLDPMQKGCSLLTDNLYNVVHKYWDQGLQIAIVANGSYQPIFRDIVARHDFYDRVLVCDFDEGLSRLAFAASDFILMPSLFEPCGLPQMTSQYFGSLPVVHDTGGLHDTVEPLNVNTHTGNGFLFETSRRRRAHVGDG